MAKSYLMGAKLQVTPEYKSDDNLAIKTIQTHSNGGKTFSGYYIVVKTGLSYHGPVAVGDKVTLGEYFDSVYQNLVNEQTGRPNEGASIIIRDQDIEELITDRDITSWLEITSSEKVSKRGQESN